MKVLPSRAEARTALTVTRAEQEQAANVDQEAMFRALPRELGGVIKVALGVIARGGTVTIGSLPDELTTTTAADVLDISRPTLMKWIKDGSLASYKVGSHTRLKADDVIAFRDARQAEQRRAFNALRSFEDANGLDY